MRKPRKKDNSNLYRNFLLMIFLCIGCALFLITYALTRYESAGYTTATQAYDYEPNEEEMLYQNEDVIDGQSDIQADKCSYEIVDYGRIEGHGPCYRSVQILCTGGSPYAGRPAFRALPPSGSGACLLKSQWEKIAAQRCGCTAENEAPPQVQLTSEPTLPHTIDECNAKSPSQCASGCTFYSCANGGHGLCVRSRTKKEDVCPEAGKHECKSADNRLRCREIDCSWQFCNNLNAWKCGKDHSDACSNP